MPDTWFRNKIVLIGSDVTLVDRHRTPFSAILPAMTDSLPGIVIQAHGLSQLLHRGSPMRVGRSNSCVALALALLGAAWA